MQILSLILCLIILVLLAVVLVLLFKSKNVQVLSEKNLENVQEKIQQLNMSMAVSSSRLDEMDKKSGQFNALVDNRLAQFSNDNLNLSQMVEKKLSDIQQSNEKRLEQMRQTVEEKLQSTLVHRS